MFVFWQGVFAVLMSFMILFIFALQDDGADEIKEDPKPEEKNWGELKPSNLLFTSPLLFLLGEADYHNFFASIMVFH